MRPECSSCEDKGAEQDRASPSDLTNEVVPHLEKILARVPTRHVAASAMDRGIVIEGCGFAE